MSLGETLLVLVIYVLVVISLTRLINYDFLTDPLRLWIAGRRESAGDAVLEAEENLQPAIAQLHTRRQARWGAAYEFVTCPWCVSFWWALPAALPVVDLLDWSRWAVWPLAFAARVLTGLADRWVGETIQVVKS